MPFIQVCEDIAADFSGRNPSIPLVITVVSVLGVEQLSPGVGNDLPRFPQRAGETQEQSRGNLLGSRLRSCPESSLFPFRGGFEIVLLGLYSGLCGQCLISQLLGGFGPRGGSQWLFNWELATKLAVRGTPAHLRGRS